MPEENEKQTDKTLVSVLVPTAELDEIKRTMGVDINSQAILSAARRGVAWMKEATHA